MSSENWVVIFTTSELHIVELVKGMLEENGIVSIIRSYGDSTMMLPAKYELFVTHEHVIKAKHLIQKTIDDIEA
jgi:hypothetical protein